MFSVLFRVQLNERPVTGFRRSASTYPLEAKQCNLVWIYRWLDDDNSKCMDMYHYDLPSIPPNPIKSISFFMLLHNTSLPNITSLSLLSHSIAGRMRGLAWEEPIPPLDRLFSFRISLGYRPSVLPAVLLPHYAFPFPDSSHPFTLVFPAISLKKCFCFSCLLQFIRDVISS